MILDLHSHSIRSDDGRAKVENYCQWIRKRDLPLDGLVLTEHRQFDSESDYRKLEDEFGLLVLKASEVETEYGHVLLFGVNEELENAFDFSRLDLQLAAVVEQARRNDAIAIPCHPGRTRVGMCAHYDTLGPVEGVEVIETLNGGSRGTENEEAIALATEYGYHGIGGSDAHIVSFIGRCATRFENEISSIADLVHELRGGAFEAISYKE
jgi:predicted metal-dependent phosphoesterase TrpH